MPRSALPLVLVAGLLAARAAEAQPAPPVLPAERVGEVLAPPPPAPHHVWVADHLLRRTALLDGDSGRFLGMLSTGTGAIAPVFSQARGEIYLPETYYSRGSRGERSDVVTVYDVATLAPVAEVAIPPRRADVVHGVGLATLLDDGRFLAIYNFTPATSVSIVDVAARRFVGEIATPGCSLVYGAGPRRFLMLCSDGSLLLVTLDEGGAEASRVRTARLSDPIADPVTEKPVRLGSEWLFATFSGEIRPVDVGGEALRFGPPWSLLDDADRAASWRIGGTQHLALHEDSGRLYALVHRGGPDGHKEPGTEIRVYDVATRARVQTIALRNLLAAFLVQQMGARSDALLWVLERLVPNPGVDSIAVSQDAEPLLFGVSMQAGTVGVWDARSGAFLRHLENVGLAPGVLQAPWR
jgi:methylamine dehydrogenase heavy chain